MRSPSPSIAAMRRMRQEMLVTVSVLLTLAACGSSATKPVPNEQRQASISLKNGIGKVALSGCVGFDYMATFNVGGQPLNLLMDSGSTSFGMAGQQCNSCRTESGVKQTYALSSTGRKTGFTASSSYADGSKWSGTVIEDLIAVGDQSTLATPAVSVNFADIVSEDAFFEAVTCTASDDTAFDGIAGLGPDGQLMPHTTSFLTQLSLSNAMAADMFSMQMCDVGGWAWFGGIDASSMTAAPNYTPIVQADSPGYFVAIADMSLGGTSLGVAPSKLGPMVVDSGTNALVLTASAFAAFEQEIEANSAYAANFGSGFISASGGECKVPKQGLSRAQIDAQFPRLAMTFPKDSGGTFSIDMPASSSYLVAHADASSGGNTYYCPAVAGYSDDTLTILGNAVMRQFVVIFDRQNSGRIGFAPQTGCKQTALYLPPGT